MLFHILHCCLTQKSCFIQLLFALSNTVVFNMEHSSSSYIPQGNQYCLLFALNFQFIVSPNSLIRVKLAEKNLKYESQEKSNRSQPVFVIVYKQRSCLLIERYKLFF